MKKVEGLENYLKDFLEELSKIDIRNIDIPKFYIPNWPKEAFVDIPFGRKECLVLTATNKTGLCKFVKRKTKRKSYLRINKDGGIEFAFHDWGAYYDKYSSKSDDKLIRLRVLFLFNQFKEELIKEIITRLKNDAGVHNEVIKKAEEVFKPFIPYVVADKLSE